MKFDTLKYLFQLELEERKKEKSNARFIIRAYKNILKKIEELYEGSETVTQKKLQMLKITNGMKKKLLNLSKQKLSKNNNKQFLKIQLKELIGIGDKKAEEIIKAGLKNVKQLERKKWQKMLNEESRLMLRHKPLRKISNAKIKMIEKKLTGLRGYKIQLMGSYRRKKLFSKDIDVLLCEQQNKDPFDKYLIYLKKQF